MDSLRLADADRDAALSSLAEHFAAGRIDREEFDERSDAIWSAKTRADLVPVFADLIPEPTAVLRRRTSTAGVARRWQRWPLPLGPVILALVLLTVVTHVPFILLGVLGSFLLGRRLRYR